MKKGQIDWTCPECGWKIGTWAERVGDKIMVTTSCDICDYEGFLIEIDLRGIDPKKFRRKGKIFKIILQPQE